MNTLIRNKKQWLHQLLLTAKHFSFIDNFLNYENDELSTIILFMRKMNDDDLFTYINRMKTDELNKIYTLIAERTTMVIIKLQCDCCS